MANSRNQTKTITIPSGTAAGSVDTSLTLDRQYRKAVGVAAYVNKNGGIPAFQMGLRDEINSIVEPTNGAFFQAGIDCPKPHRFTPIDIVIDGTLTYVTLTWPATLTTDLVIDVVFSLVKE